MRGRQLESDQGIRKRNSDVGRKAVGTDGTACVQVIPAFADFAPAGVQEHRPLRAFWGKQLQSRAQVVAGSLPGIDDCLSLPCWCYPFQARKVLRRYFDPAQRPSVGAAAFDAEDGGPLRPVVPDNYITDA